MCQLGSHFRWLLLLAGILFCLNRVGNRVFLKLFSSSLSLSSLLTPIFPLLFFFPKCWFRGVFPLLSRERPEAVGAFGPPQTFCFMSSKMRAWVTLCGNWRCGVNDSFPTRPAALMRQWRFPGLSPVGDPATRVAVAWPRVAWPRPLIGT